MPLEIKELLIKITVDENDGKQGQNTTGKPETVDKQAIVENADVVDPIVIPVTGHRH